MKKTLYFSFFFLALFVGSCGESGESTDGDSNGKIIVKSADEFVNVIESTVDTIYLGFNLIEDLDGADVPKSELLDGINKLASEISVAKTKLKSIEPYGENPTPLLDAAKKCLVASKKLLSFFKRNASLLSKPDNEWTDSEYEKFDKMNTKFNNGLETAMDKLYDMSDAYLSRQPIPAN